MLGDDGQQWATDDGQSFHDLALSMGARVRIVGNAERVEFDDDSVIVAHVNGWNYGVTDSGPACVCWPTVAFTHALGCPDDA